MADRRPEDMAPTAPFTPVPDQPGGAQPPGAAYDEQRELSERINAAYASSGPIVTEEPGDESRPKGRPSGAERFAAVLAATMGRGAQGRPVGAAEENRSEGSRPAKGGPAKSGPAKGSRPKAPAAKATTPRRVRRARLRLTHIDPWSVMKTAFLLSVAIGIVTVVAVGVVWAVLGAAGVWSSIDSAIGDVLGQSSEGFRIEDYVGMSRVMGFTLIVAVVDVVLITVIATLGAFLYNLAAALLGGVEVVLAEEGH